MKTTSSPPNWPRLLFWIVGCIVVIYGLAGFVVIPMIAEKKLPGILSDALNADVTVKDIDFNPFTFRAAVNGLSVSMADGAPLLEAGRVSANVQLASVVKMGAVIKSVEIRTPLVHVVRRADGSLNLSDLAGGNGADTETETRTDENDGSPVYFSVAELRITDGQVMFTDKASGFDTTIDPVFVLIENLGSEPSSMADFEIRLQTRAEESIACTGRLGLFPVSAEARLDAQNLSVAHYAPFYRDLTGLEIKDGRADISGDIIYPQPSPVSENPLLENGKIRLRSLLVRDPDTGNAAVEIPEFTIAGVRVDTKGRSVDVENVSTRGGKILCERSENGTLNFSKLTAGTRQAESSAADTVPEKPEPAPSPAPWNVHLGLISVSGYSVAYTDALPKQPVSLGLDGLTIRLYDMTLQQDHLTEWSFASLARPGIVSARGTFQLDPLTAAFEFRISEVDLAGAAPYARDFGADIQKGIIHATGRVEAGITPEGLSAQYAGEARIDDFTATDPETGKRFFSFHLLGFENIHAQSTDSTAVSMDRILIQKPMLTLGLETDGTMFPPVLAGEDKIDDDDTTEDARANGKNVSAQKPPAGSDDGRQTEKPSFTAEIRQIEMQEGGFAFFDNSVSPPFAARLSPMDANISDVQLDPQNVTDFTINGRLDGQAPFTVSGKIRPLAPKDMTLTQVKFDNIEMPMFTPYFGKYLGYEIQKGKLHLDLGYQVDSLKLDGKNQLRLDQFFLGNKVQSEDAISLPLKLALALLRDRAGKIDLNVPVEGDMRNPKFRLGGVIFDAFVNLLKRLVTSPFSALASLVPGAEELRYVDFAPGSPDLTDKERDKLEKLATALYERPGLRLLVRPGADPVRDRQAFQQTQVQKLILAEAGHGDVSEEDLNGVLQELPENDYENYLKAVCNSADINAEDMSVAEMEAALRQTIEIPDTRLRQLADQRGRRVRNTLLADDRIEAGRVFMENPKTTDQPRVEFELEAG